MTVVAGTRQRFGWDGAPLRVIAFTHGFAKRGDRVVIAAGLPLGTPGATNMLRVAFVTRR
jgi:hypothetical protein